MDDIKDNKLHEDGNTESDNSSLSSMFTSLLTPLNIILLCICFILIYKIFKTKQHDANITDEFGLPPLKKRDFTLEQLREENNKNGRILIAVNGKVFDVTKNRKQYGPDGPYGVFAGRDASRSLGTFSLTGDAIRDVYDDLSDLTSKQMERIKEWEMQFTESYQLLGRLLKPGEEPAEYTDTEEEHSFSDRLKKD